MSIRTDSIKFPSKRRKSVAMEISVITRIPEFHILYTLHLSNIISNFLTVATFYVDSQILQTYQSTMCRYVHDVSSFRISHV